MPPSRRLTRESLVGAALDIADEDGLAGVTLARVATQVGCQPPSLYNHLSGIDDLLDEMALAATAEFSDALRDAVVARVGEEAVREYAHAWRAYVTTHPARYEVTLRSLPDRRHEQRTLARGITMPVSAVLSTFGVPDDRLEEAGRALRAGLHGFCHLELGGTMGPHPDDTFEVTVDVLVEGLRSYALGSESTT